MGSTKEVKRPLRKDAHESRVRPPWGGKYVRVKFFGKGFWVHIGASQSIQDCPLVLRPPLGGKVPREAPPGRAAVQPAKGVFQLIKGRFMSLALAHSGIKM
jgi:hypothetical protein